VAPLLAVALGCARRVPEAPPAPPPNVVLIVLDTVRADHLGCYGYARATSPSIDAFARGATRYTRAISSAPWTVPSHASMFTGKPPFEHGAHTVLGEGPSDHVNALDQRHLTLAEALGEAGYRTGAFAANAGFLARHWQLDQGFETYHVERVLAGELNERVFAWLEHEAREPFFLFVNYIDAHRPYNTDPQAGLLDPPASRDTELLDDLIEAVLPGDADPPAALVRQVIDQYDTAIVNLDREVGRLLESLGARGLAERTITVVTSDHGEYFGEHRLVEHSKDVYQPALAVPLLIRTPGQAAGRAVDDLVDSSDLPRLIFSALPPALRETLEAKFPERDADLVLAENYYTRRKDLIDPRWGHRFQRVRRALFDWPHKYIHSSDGAHELYRLDRDPAEAINLLESESEVAARLAARLAAYEAERRNTEPPPEPETIDEELRMKLVSLGYVGG
jgi:arylsulfatase A-like enzyme